MQIMRVLCGLWLLASLTTADYLEVRRNATIKEEPDRDALIFERVQPPVHLALVPVPNGTNDQVNGYYRVRRPGGDEGWIYRTLVRRHSGPLPSHLGTTVTGTGELVMHFIDVGQGDSTLIECPGGYTILVDCGSTSDGDAQAVRNYLLGELDPASPRIDALVITHPDADHYNLIPTVLAGVEIGHVYTAGADSEHSRAGVDDWLGTFHSNRKTILGVSDFDPAGSPNSSITAGDADVYVLAAGISATESAKNARSIVLLVDYGDFEAILTGDATFDTEDAILGRYDSSWLEVELLKLGHHGSSTTSTDDDWLEATSPEMAVVSASHTNGYGHPRKSVLEAVSGFTATDSAHPIRWGWWDDGPKFGNVPAYREAIYCTATNGTVVVSSAGGSYQVATSD